MKVLKYHDHTASVGFNFIGEMDNLNPNPDLIIFTGGADVNPGLYGEKKHPYTVVNFERDKLDLEKFAEFRTTPKLMICRGAQFGCVMAGGKLIQHVSGHGLRSTHEIETFDGKKLEITSTHHQMMYPWDVKNHYILAHNFNLSDTYQGENEEEIFKAVELHKKGKVVKPLITEPEIVYFPDIKALCVQGHPEYYNCPQETKDYIKFLTKKLVEDELEDYIWSKEEA